MESNLKYTIDCNGTERWQLPNGEFHREDGPAFIGVDGTTQWFIEGKCHRDDGPASIWGDGSQMWCRYGVIHREDGPAYIEHNGVYSWYVQGFSYSFKEYCNQLELSEQDVIILKLKYGC